MRKLILRLTVTLVTLTIGLMLSGVFKHLRRQPPQEPCPVPSPQTEILDTTEADNEYPETLGLQPYEIEWFIDDHPSAKLSRLWERLKIKPSHPEINGDFACYSRCSAEIFNYDLDNEPGDEILLRVGDEFAPIWRYLVFKQSQDDGWKMLGSIDVWDKYEPARHIVLQNQGKPYLILTQLAAYGSGIALYENHIYEVNKNALRELMSYPGSGYLASEPALRFNTHVLSCEVKKGRTSANVEYVFEYSSEVGETKVILFSKRQKAMLTTAKGGVDITSRHQSEDADYESDTLNFIDSMTGSDFLKYNYSELLKLAARGNSEQRRWLKEYLQSSDSGAQKRQLLAALAK